MTREYSAASILTSGVVISGGGGGGGNVTGPGSAVIDDIVTFADTTGKLIKDSGILISSWAMWSGGLPDIQYDYLVAICWYKWGGFGGYRDFMDPVTYNLTKAGIISG